MVCQIEPIDYIAKVIDSPVFSMENLLRSHGKISVLVNPAITFDGDKTLMPDVAQQVDKGCLRFSLACSKTANVVIQCSFPQSFQRSEACHV